MNIVPVTAENFSQALDVYRCSYRVSHRAICSPAFLERRDYAGYLKGRMNGLYLLTDGEPAGIVRVTEQKISDLYVHPQKEGHGYGTALMRYAMVQCKAPRLTVLSSNDRAICLYKHLGFDFTGSNIQLREDLWEMEMRYMEKDNG